MMRMLVLGGIVVLWCEAALGAEASADDSAQSQLQAILKEAARRVDGGHEAEAAPDPKAVRKAAHAKNLILRNGAWDKAAELKRDEVRDLKAARMPDARKVADEIASLERTIRDKERKRKAADRSWYTGEGGTGGTGGGDPGSGPGGLNFRRRKEKPKHNDGLENDQKALQQAQVRKRELQRQIAGEMKRLDDREALRKRRVEAIYTRHKLAVDADKTPTPDEMLANYKAALAVADPEPPKPEPAPAAGAEKPKPPPRKDKKPEKPAKRKPRDG